MRKTTNETIKSVIQDWLAECETVDEIYQRTKYIEKENNVQGLILSIQRTAKND